MCVPRVIAAAQRGDASELALLLESGESSNVCDEQYRMPALHWACASDEAKCVKVLIEGACDKLAKSAHGMTALHVAAMENITTAREVAYALLRLLQNVSTLTASMEAKGISQTTAIELVQIQFLHPVEGLVVVRFAPMPDLSAAQTVARSNNTATAETIAAVTAAVSAAVAAAVAAAVGGAVAGAVGGAAR